MKSCKILREYEIAIGIELYLPKYWSEALCFFAKMLRISRLINVGPHICEISRDLARKQDRDRHLALSSLILVRSVPFFCQNAQNLKGKKCRTSDLWHLTRIRDCERHIALSSLILVWFPPFFRKNAQNLKGKKWNLRFMKSLENTRSE